MTILIDQYYITGANGFSIPVVGIGTMRLLISITNQDNKVHIKKVVLNGVRDAP